MKKTGCGDGANILGLSVCTGHDAAAAIIKDGKLYAAIEEERFNRIKHYGGFPELSIRYCLEESSLSPKDIDYIGIPLHPWAHMLKRVNFALFNHPRQAMRRLKFIAREIASPLRLKSHLERLFPKVKVIFIEHHLAHAASAFYASPFAEAAIFSVDGRGEWSTALLGIGAKDKIIKLKEAFYPNSLGLLYLAFTHYLGFETHDEYKVMGLSAYGAPRYIDFFRQEIRFSKDKIFNVNLDLINHPGFSPIGWNEKYFSKRVISTFGLPRTSNAPINNVHMDVARSLQERINEIGVEIANYLHRITKKDYLCLAGGVALNGIMNYKIKNESPFKDIFIQPAAGDGGVSVGSAFYIQHDILGEAKRDYFENAYWGPQYSDEEVKRELETARLEYVVLKDPSYVAANLIKDSYIIGWFQGRTEFGPRALGNRSILADPRKAENKDVVNMRIKFREEFRPFAPSILEEYAHDYYLNCGVSPYMLLVCPVKNGKSNEIPAVTHLDNTGRVQTVSQKANPAFYSLIKHFYDLTGVPVVLNTSFNVKGEPIVNAPVDAIRCFFTTGLDFLIVNQFLLYKKPLSEFVLKVIQQDRKTTSI